MFWIIGSLAACAAVLGFCTLLIGARNPRRSFWFKDSLIANIYIPGIIGTGLLGIGLLGRSLFVIREAPPSLFDVFICLAMVAATLACVKMLGIPKRLAGYDKKREILETIELAKKRRAATPAPPEPSGSAPTRPRKAA